MQYAYFVIRRLILPVAFRVHVDLFFIDYRCRDHLAVQLGDIHIPSVERCFSSLRGWVYAPLPSGSCKACLFGVMCFFVDLFDRSQVVVIRFSEHLAVYRLAELSLVQILVSATKLEELVVRALLGDDSVLHDEYLICLKYGGEPVGDHYARAPLHHVFERVLYGVLRNGVESRCRLIEYEYLRIFQYDSRKRQPLLLTTRQLESAVTHLSAIAVRLRAYEVVYVGDLAGFLYIRHRSVFVGVLQIFEYGAVEEICLLRNDSYLSSQILEVEVPHVHTGHLYRTA